MLGCRIITIILCISFSSMGLFGIYQAIKLHNSTKFTDTIASCNFSSSSCDGDNGYCRCYFKVTTNTTKYTLFTLCDSTSSHDKYCVLCRDRFNIGKDINYYIYNNIPIWDHPSMIYISLTVVSFAIVFLTSAVYNHMINRQQSKLETEE